MDSTNTNTSIQVPLLSLLKEHFGFTSFRPLQEEIIRDALAGRDVVALLPTGGGKSLCFHLPALARPGLTLVVSPLQKGAKRFKPGTAKLRRRGRAISMETAESIRLHLPKILNFFSVPKGQGLSQIVCFQTQQY